MDSGNSRNDTQCIYRPFTPEKGQRNTRGAFGRFKRTLKLKKTTRESLSEGYEIWSTKLHYEDGCVEKEPPTKQALRSSREATHDVQDICFFASLENKNYRFDRSRSLVLKSGSDFHQQTAAKDLQGTLVVDIQTFSQGLKECLLCKRGKYE